MKKMKKMCVPIVMALVFLLSPFLVSAAEFHGSIQGLNCVIRHEVCPIGKEDIVIATENVFVLLVDAAKGEYYFIPNLDSRILARHIGEPVKVVGTVDKKETKSIMATELWSRADSSKWVLVWSKAWQNDLYRSLHQ